MLINQDIKALNKKIDVFAARNHSNDALMYNKYTKVEEVITLHYHDNVLSFEADRFIRSWAKGQVILFIDQNKSKQFFYYS